MEQTQTIEQPQNITAPAPVAPPQDPFALDENALVSLSPEQRASLDPILDGWKKKAADEIQKKETEVTGKYKPMEEKVKAFEKLTQYQPFVQWWQSHAQAAAGANPSQQQNINQTKPQDIATPQEWQEAVYDASNGDGTKLNALQQRMMATWAMPVIKDLTEKQQRLDTQFEIRDLFESHADAKELDAIGLDPKTKEGTSLLEMALDWAERNGKPLEEGYKLARTWADSFKVGAQQQAMGMLNEKKQTVTAGPSTSTANQTVVEVANADELLKRSMEAQLSGQKDVRFVIKGSR